jgi:UDP-N-acetyl-2-amino-2-deoxyglucuronate dehydrogenase
VEWVLSIDAGTLPDDVKKAGKRTYRSLTINGEGFEFSDGFTELHTKSYDEILKNNGFRLSEIRRSIDLVHNIRNAKTS